MSPRLVISLQLVLLALFNPCLSNVIDEQACADKVLKDCKCRVDGLQYVIRRQSGRPSEQKTWCLDLQGCVDCMFTSRCDSRYLERFRSLLLTTSVLSVKSRLCPALRYRHLLGLEKGSGKSCKGLGLVSDQCGMRCNCKGGKLFHCYRLRREFTRMSFEERSRYVDAFYKATTDPIYKDDFEQLLNKHSRMPSKYLHHMPQIFFPWHRWYLLKIESFLKQIDCRVTIPYWQWTAQAGHLWRTGPFDVWASGHQGLGGNGIPPSGCVQDGLFREGNWYMPLSKGRGCMAREFNLSCVLPDEAHLNETLNCDDFSKFEEIIRDKYHNNFHNCVGRLMRYHHTASNTPEFLLHHAFIDKVWNSWQNKKAGNMYQYFSSLNYRMPLADRYPWEYLNNNALPGDLRVMYEE